MARRLDLGMVNEEVRVNSSFIPLCLCISENTLKAVGSFNLVSIQGEVQYPKQEVGLRV